MDAHLLFQAHALEAVALARRARGVGHDLRHDEQRQAAGSGGRALGPRQDQLHQVGGEVLLAARDPDLFAGDPPGPVLGLHRLAADQPQVGAALRLGEVHRPGPLAGGQPGQVERLLGLVAGVFDGRKGAVGQARIHGEGHVGRRGHLVEGQAQDPRQALTAPLGVHCERAPARLHHALVGVGEAGGGPDRAGGGIVLAALLVAHRVQRLQHPLAEAGGLLEQLAGQLGRGVGEAGQAGMALEVQDLVEQEQIFLHRRLVGHQGRLLCKRSAILG